MKRLRRLRPIIVVLGGALAGIMMSVVLIKVLDAITQQQFYQESLSGAGDVQTVLLKSVPLLETSIIIASFAFGFLFVAAPLYKKPPWRFLTNHCNFRWNHFIVGFLVFGVIHFIFLIYVLRGDIFDLLTASHTTKTSLVTFCLVTFVFYIPAVLGEEILFRSWLLGRFSKSAIKNFMLIASSAAIFSLFHLSSDPSLIMMRLVSGASYAWCVFRLGGIELSFGAHLAKNTVLACIIGIDSPVDSDITGRIVLFNIGASITLFVLVEILSFWRIRCAHHYEGLESGL